MCRATLGGNNKSGPFGGAVELTLDTSMAADTSPVVQRHSGDVDGFDIGDTKVQHYGLLMKKPFGHKSGRWQRR